jgi:hypothetical protein
VIHTTDLAGLAQAQAIPLPYVDAITIRYDAGVDSDGDPVVYAVVDSEDLCKLPVDVLSSLGVGADRQDIDGDPVFFAGNDHVLRLFVDTDAYPSFKADLIDIAEDHGLDLRDAHGDLRALCGGQNDIGKPNMPAFVHAGHERIDSNVALAMLAYERQATPVIYIGKEDDAPGSEFC